MTDPTVIDLNALKQRRLELNHTGKDFDNLIAEVEALRERETKRLGALARMSNEVKELEQEIRSRRDMTHKFDFEYEIEALGQSVLVTVSVTPSSFPDDPGPDGEGEIEIDSVTLNGFDVDTDGLKICRMVPILTPLGNVFAPKGKPRKIPEWVLLTDLIREAAWGEAEREAA